MSTARTYTKEKIDELLAAVGGGGGGGGSTWRSGSTVPSSGLGIDGDFYLRTSNGDVYQKASGTYSIVANIKGPAGATGLPGADGTDGTDGAPGVVQSVVAGLNVTVDATDPAHPIVSSTGGGGGGSGGSGGKAIVVAAANSSAADKALANVVCTGTSGNAADDADAINAAAALDAPLLMLDGDYYVDSPIDLTLFGNRAMSLNRHGAKVHARSTNNEIMVCAGTAPDNQATLAAQANEGATTLTLTAAGSIVNNSWYNIKTTDPWSDDTPSPYPTGYKGEWVFVTAGAGTTTLTLANALRDTYALTPSAPILRKLTNVDAVHVQGIQFIGFGESSTGSGTGGPFGLRIQYFTDARVIDCHFQDLKVEGLRARAGIGLLVEKCTGARVCPVGTAGAMLKAMGVDNAIFTQNSGGEDCRHLIDVDGYSPDPVGRNTILVGNICNDTVVSGINTHCGCEMTAVVGNSAMRGGAGIMVRGKSNTVTGNTIIGPHTATYPAAIVIGDGNDQTHNGIAGTNLVVANNVVHSHRTTSMGAHDGIRCYDSLYNARISGNVMIGFNGHGIFCDSPQAFDVIISDNIFDCSKQLGSRDFVNITPNVAASGRYQRDVRIYNNMLTGAPTRDAVRFTGSTTGTASSGIHVFANDFRGAGVTLTNITNANQVVRGNDGRGPVMNVPLGVFYITGAGGTDALTKLSAPGGSQNTGVVATHPGSIVGLSVIANAARTAGTATFEVYINGTATGLQVTIDGTNTTKHFASQAAKLDMFAAGDTIDVRYSATTYTPDPTTFNASVTVEM